MKILLIFGTRPEAIKVAPVIRELDKHRSVKQVICITGQHKEMIEPVLKIFNIKPSYNLEVMKQNQTLLDICARSMERLKAVFSKEKPDMVLVQGDTTTALIGALASYYFKTPIAHIEAGLRTYDKYSPFPEELNRVLIDHIADLCFAPTENAKKKLINERIEEDKVFVTGNTAIDALLWVVGRLPALLKGRKLFRLEDPDHKLILVTGHRRENFGAGFKNICYALKDIALRNQDVEIVYPVHLNPNVRKPVLNILERVPRISLIEPVDYALFVDLMRKAYIVLTDSGGIQEEAPSLGKPILVMRNTTERPEGVEAGAAKLVGVSKDFIIEGVEELLEDKNKYRKMAKTRNPYGDGKSAERIVKILSKRF